MQNIQIQILLNVLDEVTKKYDDIFDLKETLLEEANYKGSHDLMTSLYNREFFNKKVKNLLKEKMNLSLVFLDLDNFKYVNDTFGHDKGDKILIDTANILRKNLKGKDLIARFGGDEFVMSVLDCNKKCATELFTKIENQIQNYFKEYNVTASIGISFSDEENNYEKLLKIADSRMYISKENGKATITIKG